MHQEPVPEFVAIGHVTRDLHPDGSFSPGGTVTFATQCAAALGLRSGIVSRADDEVRAVLSTLLPTIALHISPSPQSTTFANLYQNGFRTQFLYAQGVSIQLTDIPTAWLQAPIVLFGPVAQELAPDLLFQFPRHPGAILAATPQGWLRRWDADHRVWPTPWQAAEAMLPLLDVLILSHDDLLPFAGESRLEADAILAHWSTLVPLLVATDGRHGADLYHAGNVEHFPAYPTQERDPTGAGDVFATAFLTHLYRHGDPTQAVDFANCVASFSIEQPGIQGIPTLAQVEQRRQFRAQ